MLLDLNINQPIIDYFIQNKNRDFEKKEEFLCLALVMEYSCAHSLESFKEKFTDEVVFVIFNRMMAYQHMLVRDELLYLLYMVEIKIKDYDFYKEFDNFKVLDNILYLLGYRF